MTAVRQPGPRRPAPAAGPFEIALVTSLGLVFTTFFSWGLGVLIEIVGIYTLWPDQAERHSHSLVLEDLGYIEASPRSLLVRDTNALAHEIVRQVEWPYQKFGLIAWYRSEHGSQAQQPPDQVGERGLAAAWRELSTELSRWLLISMYVAQDTLLRLAIAVFALPAFALACLLGAVDGLVRRELRRWGGGRESSFVYHHSKRWTRWALTGGFMAYLTWPFGGFNPAYMVLVFTALIAATLSTTLAAFKKYL